MIERTDTGHLIYRGYFYYAESVRRCAERVLHKAGSNNVAFDMIPLFYTGSPYGEAIVDLGCEPVVPPDSFRIESVPHDMRKPWRRIEPIWPEVFGVDQLLYEKKPEVTH